MYYHYGIQGLLSRILYIQIYDNKISVIDLDI